MGVSLARNCFREAEAGSSDRVQYSKVRTEAIR